MIQGEYVEQTPTLRRLSLRDRIHDQDSHTATSSSGVSINGSEKHYEHPNQSLHMAAEGPWRPGFLIRLPVFGIMALLGVFFCLIFSTILVVKADQSLQDGYKVRPSVLLAVSSAVANTLLAFALTVGTTISWWRKVVHGCTLESLHYHWIWSRSFFAALYSVRYHKPIVLASAFATLAILDGPFLQKSIHPGSTLFSYTEQMPVRLNTQMPPGFSGPKIPGSNTIMGISPNFSKILQKKDHLSNFSFGTACDDEETVCQGNFTGIGLTPICEDLPSVPLLENKKYGSYEIFSVHSYWKPEADTPFPAEKGQYTGIFYEYSSSSYAIGDCDVAKIRVNFTRCQLLANTVLYKPASIPFSGLLDFLSEDNLTIVDVEEPLPRYLSSEKTAGNSTWGGFAVAFETYLSSSISLDLSEANDSSKNQWDLLSVNMRGPLAIDHASVGDLYSSLSVSTDKSSIKTENSPSICTSWTDSSVQLDIMRFWNRVMLDIATRDWLDASNMSSTLQMVNVAISSSRQTYQANFRYLVTGLVLMAAALCAVATTFYGWWEIGWDATLSPIETGKAFGAPLFLSSLQQGNNAKDIISDVGKMEVAYGEVKRSGSSVFLGIAPKQLVRRPTMATGSD